MKATVEDLLARINILDIVSQHVKLRRAGKNFVGSCPFHKEKTPSFTVSLEKQIYYCFGCHEGGNAINFLMKYENLTFQEALENLGSQYGLEVARRSGTKRAGALDALSKLADYYHQALKRSGAAREYLARRGIDTHIIKEFMIGFSDRTRYDLKGFLKDSGVPPDILLNTGVIRMKDGGAYDIFRGRIVIPILDVNGHVIGFGGRTMDKDGLPKYINSPESSVFSKRSALFGIDKTRKRIAEMSQVFIVEGYFDFISLYQHGLRNIVATLGTAVTEGQLARLRNYTDNITLMLDGDEAGIKSALRLVSLFSDMDINGSMVALPSGHDPDSLVREEGIEGVTRIINEKKPILDYFFDYAKNKYGVDTLEGKMAFIKSVMPHVEAIRDTIKKRLYIKRLSDLTGLEEQHLWEGMKRKEEDDVLKVETPTSIIGRRVVGVLLNNPDLLQSCSGQWGLVEYVKDHDIKAILSRIIDYFKKRKELVIQSFVQTLEVDALKDLVLRSSLDTAEYDELESERVVIDYFRYLEKNSIKKESQRITEKLLEAEKKGDDEEIMKLLERKREVLELMKSNPIERGGHA
ncbi:DNA primase [Syntrophorhabdus aromaticivorans]|uniref:DNA primase n=1 Tax=Syntrophorhabdus aromaticivorans TaxID=328301 RepID=A0A971RZR4_9BACT|nr:DNA primase [Syntrophorhabdus aromaticivorans]NLW34231.1 DNA primase [Syntrophorhabdus aromaticivorans]